MGRLNFRLRSGGAILAVFLCVGVLWPSIMGIDGIGWNIYPRNLPPSLNHLLGTTNLGQDTFSLLTAATLNSILLGVTVAALATTIGVIIGLTAGFTGGAVDRVLSLLMDVFVVIPPLPILILIASFLRGRASLFVIAGILVLFNWPWPARQSRSGALTMREREFINVARFSGEGPHKLIAREIFPYIRSWSMANFVNTVLVAIATETGLAVIGLSSLDQPTLGTMIYWALQHQAILLERWLWIGSPTVAIVALFIGLFLLSTGIHDWSAEQRGH